MHIPKIFKQENSEELLRLIATFPLATLFIETDGDLSAHHLPFKFIETADNSNDVSYLEGHIALANPLYSGTNSPASVLLVFHGPDGYVSPSYYPSKGLDPKVVPTWNYMAVHVQGELTFITDDVWKLGMLERMTNKMEVAVESEWRVSDAPTDYIAKQLKGIVGVKIEIKSMVGKWKLSQNKSTENTQGVIKSLEKQDDTRVLAEEMQKLER